MDLQDMKEIITAFDGAREVEKSANTLSGGITDGESKDGALGKLNCLWNVIERHAVLYQTKSDEEDPTAKFYLIWCTATDDTLDAEFRAKIILGLL